VSRVSVIPFGPQHASFLEPMNLKLTMEEEKVVGATINIGYNHRGMEFAMAQDYKRTVFLCERICGICSYHHSSAYVQAMENAFAVKVGDRANLVRTIMMECQRLTSHLLALGHTAEALGYENLFMQFFREREDIMMLVNRVSGNRVHYSMNTIGGLRKDVTYEQLKDIEKTMDLVEPKFLELQKVIRTDSTFRKRTRGIGVLTKANAESYCVVGPVGRGSGMPHDIRLTGFAGYGVDGMKFKPVVYEEGDVYARNMVRMDESIQAVDLIRQALNLIRDGPFLTPVKGHPTAEGIGRVEAPRGELFYYAKGVGQLKLDRIRVRTPAFVNIPAIAAMIGGAQLCDVAPIAVSVDPCICCCDR
jgi:ech hydrogenase subunit E